MPRGFDGFKAGKDKPWLLFFMLLLLVLCTAFGCVMLGPSSPISQQEMLPVRNQDPRLGLIVNRGTAHQNFYLYDQAGRLIEQGYLAGNSRYLTVNGRSQPSYWVRTLPVGRYRMELYPFYYATQPFPPRRYRVDLRKTSIGISVPRNPTAQYYAGRYWGWVRQIGVDIPRNAPTPSGLPLQLDLQGNFWRVFGLGR